MIQQQHKYQQIKKEYDSIPRMNFSKPILHNFEYGIYNRHTWCYPYRDNCIFIDDLYINSSIIDSPIHKNKYIATQAPLPESFYIFWKMIIEHKVSAIFMLTDFIEKNVLKADKYWDDDDILVISDIAVSVIDYVKINNIHYRLIHIKYKEQIYVVDHYMYKKWMDNSVPDINDMYNLVELLDSHYNENTKILIHCSAGVGRTGVLIALHHYYLSIKYDKPDTIYNIVSNLREQRINMVNNLCQYVFLYDYIDKLKK